MSYIKLDRKLKDWKWANKPNMVALWVRLLLEANYYDNQFEDIVLPPGSFVTSIKSLAQKTGLTVQQTRTCISNLQITNEITIKSTNKYTIITINKWEQYQGGGKNTTNKITNKNLQNQQTNNKQTNNNKRILRNKEYKNIDEDIINRFIEAGFSEEIVNECLDVMNKYDIYGESNFIKILDILEDEDIYNKQGYIYKMRKDLN